MVGGKGGFGAQLRNTQTRVGQKKTTNFNACRDLNGRRLRHVATERMIDQGVDVLAREKHDKAKEVAREEKAEKNSEQRQEAARGLRTQVEDYHRRQQQEEEAMSLSVQRGMQILREELRRKKQGQKRPSEGDLVSGEDSQSTSNKRTSKPSFW